MLAHAVIQNAGKTGLLNMQVLDIVYLGSYTTPGGFLPDGATGQSCIPLEWMSNRIAFTVQFLLTMVYSEPLQAKVFMQSLQATVMCSRSLQHHPRLAAVEPSAWLPCLWFLLLSWLQLQSLPCRSSLRSSAEVPFLATWKCHLKCCLAIHVQMAWKI